MRTLVLALVAGLAGCSSGRPPIMVEMNGRRMEFNSFRSGRVPRGNEVVHIDSQNLQVVGDLPIEINGLMLLVVGDEVTIGGQKVSVNRDAKIAINAAGEVQVVLPARPGITPMPTQTLRAQPSPPTQPSLPNQLR